jgi:DNA-binding MarR family transcriptional regulator
MITLGKTEKFVLRYLRQYEQCGLVYHGYRSQILMALYVAQNGNIPHSYRVNMAKFIEKRRYDVLQSSLTRSLKTLENKGLVERKTMFGDSARLLFSKRRWRFQLTEPGRAIARAAAATSPDPVTTP